MAKHEVANARREEMKNSTVDGATEMISRDQNLDMGVNSALEVNLLVAMLVATVTFATGFTVPGGLVSDGEDEGLATLANKPAFKMFIVFNTLAFCSSIFAVLFDFHTSSLDDTCDQVFCKGIATSFTAVAILAMMLAFCFGTYVVLTKSTGLSLVPYIITTCFVLLYPIARKIVLWVKIFRRAIKNV